MQVRPPRDDDFAALTAITNHYITTSSVHFGYDPISEAELRGQWHHHRALFPWQVAERDGVAVGYAKAGTWRLRAAYDWTAEVSLYVLDAEHRRGVGRALYAALFEDLTRRGFRSAIAVITLPNDASCALHRACGFVPVGVVEDAGWKHGRWHAIELWQKRLATGNVPPATAGGS